MPGRAEGLQQDQDLLQRLIESIDFLRPWAHSMSVGATW